VVLLQEGHPIAYFNKKIHGASVNYPTYDKEMYALEGSSNSRALSCFQEVFYFVVTMSHLNI